jgi:hypothetical protein
MIPNITYDITDLYNFIDGLADISALVWVQFNFEDHRALLYHDETKFKYLCIFLLQLWSLNPGISAIWPAMDKAKVVSAP